VDLRQRDRVRGADTILSVLVVAVFLIALACDDTVQQMIHVYPLAPRHVILREIIAQRDAIQATNAALHRRALEQAMESGSTMPSIKSKLLVQDALFDNRSRSHWFSLDYHCCESEASK